MYFDKNTNSVWLYSTKQIYQLTIENEDRNSWKEYVEMEDYQQALDYCKGKNMSEAKKVARLYAQNRFDANDFLTSAILYGESDEKFEEVTLKFLVSENYEALKGKVRVLTFKFTFKLLKVGLQVQMKLNKICFLFGLWKCTLTN